MFGSRSCADGELPPNHLVSIDDAARTSDSDGAQFADAQERDISMAAAIACHSQARPMVDDEDSDSTDDNGVHANSNNDKLCHTAASPLVKRSKSSPVKLLTQRLSQFVTDADELCLSGPCSGRVPKHNFVKCKRNKTLGTATRIPTQFQPDYDQHGREERAKEAAWVEKHGPRKPLRSKFSKRKPKKAVKPKKDANAGGDDTDSSTRAAKGAKRARPPTIAASERKAKKAKN